jgi:hypothetical protein
MSRGDTASFFGSPLRITVAKKDALASAVTGSPMKYPAASIFLSTRSVLKIIPSGLYTRGDIRTFTLNRHGEAGHEALAD